MHRAYFFRAADTGFRFQARIVTKLQLAPGLTIATSKTDDGAHDFRRDCPMRVESALYYKRYAPSDGRPHWEDQLVPIVFQPARIDEDYDSMDDETYRSDMECTKKETSITQSVSCAENVLANQHRTHLFTILITGRKARIMR